MVFANENIRNLCISTRHPFLIIFIAAMFKTGFPMELDKFATSVCFVAAAVLPFVGVHVGEIISKTIINMVAYIFGALLGYGLCKLRENDIGEVLLLLVLFIMIALGIYGRSLIKKVKDGYDYVPIAFLIPVFVTLEYPSGPDVWLTEFDRNIKTLLLASGLTILSAFLPPFFAGDEVHNETQENIHFLADTFEDLKEKCFGLPQNLEKKLQSLINSKEKENSLVITLYLHPLIKCILNFGALQGKFVCWEPRWHPQEQYEKIGDSIRLCGSDNLSLLTKLENVQLSPDLQEKCKKIWSELAEALTRLYNSMKHKTAPAASIDDHLIRAQDLANQLKKNTLEWTAALKLTLHPDNTLELTAPVLKLASHPENKVELRNAVLNLASHPENKVELRNAVCNLASHQDNTVDLMSAVKLTSYHEHISHLFENLVSSTKELDSNVSELVTAWQSPQRFIPGIQEVTTTANQLLVAPMKKLILKCSSVSDGPDTTQPHDSEPQREEDKLGQV